MEVHLDSEEAAMARRDRKGKRRRPQGRTAAAPAEVAAQTGRVLADREAEWLGRLARDPASFAAVEREVHDQARQQADLYVAGLLAKASEHPQMAEHVAAVTAAAEVPLRPAEKKTPAGGPTSGRTGDHGDDGVLLPPWPHRQGRGREGGGLYPELAAYRISEGSSPNVQTEVGRQVALLPIEQARAELARHGLESDEKAVRRIANELGSQMLASRTRDLLRFRHGELPAGEEFKGKCVAAEIDGGRVRVRTVIKKVRVGGKLNASRSRWSGANPSC